MNSEAIETVERLDVNVFQADNEPVTVDINIVDVLLAISFCFHHGIHTLCPQTHLNTPKIKSNTHQKKG